MDYKTKPTSRRDLRRFATYVRQLFDVPEGGPFPVLDALEKLPDIFEGSGYQVVDDKILPPQTSDKGFAHLTTKETAMVDRIINTWKGEKNNAWSRWIRKQKSN